MRKHWAPCALIALIIIQVVQFTFVVHRESLTFDEGDHSFSGYMMWKTGDYGLSPFGFQFTVTAGVVGAQAAA